MKKILAFVFTGYLCLSFIVCKKNPTEPNPPKEVTVIIRTRNHTQPGQVYEKEYRGMSRDPMPIIKVSDFPVPDTDPNRMSIRKAAREGLTGNFVGFTRTGEFHYLYFPDNDEDWDGYRMNLGETTSTDYQRIDDWADKGGGSLRWRNATWCREDRDGEEYKGFPERPINEAINQLHNALQYEWAKYGSLTKVDSGGNFGIGYGHCNGHSGISSGDWAGVNPYGIADTNDRKRKIFLEEIFELMTFVDDIGHGGDKTGNLICDTSRNLNQIGKDLFAYVYVK